MAKFLGKVTGKTLGTVLGRASGGGIVPVFNPNSIDGLKQLLLVSTAIPLSGVIADERTGLGDDRSYQVPRVYDFDGTNDFINSPVSVLQSDQPYSFSFWMNRKSGVSNQLIVSDQEDGANYTGVHLANSTGLCAYKYIGGALTRTLAPISAAAGVWAHYVVTSDGTDWVMYENGVEITQTSLTTPRSGAVGFNISSSTHPLNAKLFDVRAYDIELTQEQVTAIYTDGANNVYPDNLVRHHKSDDNHPTIAFDSSGNGNDGTKTNTTPATFNVEDATAPYSFQNEVGYSQVIKIDSTVNSSWADSGTWVSSNALDGDFDVSFKILQNTTDNEMVGLFDSSSPLPTNNWAEFLLAVRDSTGGNISIARKSVFTSVSGDLAIGDIVSFNRSGSTITAYVNGALVATETGVTSTLYAAFSSSSAASEVDLINDNSLDKLSGHIGSNLEITNYFIPRDESDTANDIYGDPLQYSGIAPRNGQAVASPCGTFDGIDDYIAVPHLTGGETIVRSSGSSSPSVVAGRINFTAGTCWDLELSDGTHYTLSENSGTVAHDVSGNGNHGTITNATTTTGAGFWANTQDVFHWSVAKGFRVDNGAEIPALADGSAAADGSPITDPAGAWHNGASTDLTLYDGTWSFNEGRENPHFVRNDNGNEYADRFLSYCEPLSGADLKAVEDYTSIGSLNVLFAGQSVINLAETNEGASFTTEAIAQGFGGVTRINGAVSGSAVHFDAISGGFGGYLDATNTGKGTNYTALETAVTSSGVANENIHIIFIMIGNTDFSAIDAGVITGAEHKAAMQTWIGLLRADFPNAEIVIVPNIGDTNSRLFDGWRAGRAAQFELVEEDSTLIRGQFRVDLPQSDSDHITPGPDEQDFLQGLARQAAQNLGKIKTGGGAGPRVSAVSFDPAENEVYVDIEHDDGSDFTVGATANGIGITVNGIFNGVTATRTTATRMTLTGVTLASEDVVELVWLNGTGRNVTKANVPIDNATNPLPLLQSINTIATRVGSAAYVFAGYVLDGYVL